MTQRALVDERLNDDELVVDRPLAARLVRPPAGCRPLLLLLLLLLVLPLLGGAIIELMDGRRVVEVVMLRLLEVGLAVTEPIVMEVEVLLREDVQLLLLVVMVMLLLLEEELRVLVLLLLLLELLLVKAELVVDRQLERRIDAVAAVRIALEAGLQVDAVLRLDAVDVHRLSESFERGLRGGRSTDGGSGGVRFGVQTKTGGAAAAPGPRGGGCVRAPTTATDDRGPLIRDWI